jgi:hypothetical protein
MQKRIGHFSEIPAAKIDIFSREEKQFSRPLPQPRKLLDHVRDVLRVNHYSARTEEAYVGWIRRYILYHNKKHPRDMGALEVELYLTHLAVGEKVSANTQKQALNALVFLYHRVLQKPLGQFRDIERPKRPQRRPLVLGKDEVGRILQVMSEHINCRARLFTERLGTQISQCQSRMGVAVCFSCPDAFKGPAHGRNASTPSAREFCPESAQQSGSASRNRQACDMSYSSAVICHEAYSQRVTTFELCRSCSVIHPVR